MQVDHLSPTAAHGSCHIRLHSLFICRVCIRNEIKIYEIYENIKLVMRYTIKQQQNEATHVISNHMCFEEEEGDYNWLF